MYSVSSKTFISLSPDSCAQPRPISHLQFPIFQNEFAMQQGGNYSESANLKAPWAHEANYV